MIITILLVSAASTIVALAVGALIHKGGLGRDEPPRTPFSSIDRDHKP